MKNTDQSFVMTSPVGNIRIEMSEKGVRSVKIVHASGAKERMIPESVKNTYESLKKYFNGSVEAMNSVPVDPAGTDFQKIVWKVLRKVKAGDVTTYAALAKAVGRPRAARAVGSAMRKNPVCLIIPCHRVLPSNGTREKPGNYASGTAKKKWLLEHEVKTRR